MRFTSFPLMPILHVLLFTLIFNGLAAATPFTSLTKRQCTGVPGPVPSVEECKTHFKITPPSNGSVFYTGGTWQEATNFAHGSNPQKYILTDMLDSIQDSNCPPYSTWTDAERAQFWDNASQAMAELSLDVTFVVMPPGFVDYSTVWARIEYPALVANFYVYRIWRVDSTNFNLWEEIYPCEGQGDAYHCYL
jgi:hypothetical protein